MRARAVLLSLVVLAPLVASHSTSAAPTPDPAIAAAPLAPHVADTVLIGFEPGATGLDRAAARRAVNAVSSEQLSPLAKSAEKMILPKGFGVEKALTVLSHAKGVRYVEPDYIVTKQVTSNDPSFTNGSLWGMYGNASSPANQYGSQAAEAWTSGYTGSRSIAVGIIDEGIQVTHPDLVNNIWTNLAEKNGVAGVDDDGNGYKDDINGWDFVNNNASVYDGGSTGSQDKHGTHVSGTIGGVGGNSTGVVGVNWNVSIVSGKFLGPNGGSTSDAARALDYMTDLKIRHGLDIVATNNSWGGGGFSQTLFDAINRGGNNDILFIAAAGNSTSNNDRTASYPSNYVCTTATRTWDCVVGVAAIASNGSIATFSSYGATTVDLGAPGVGIRSTLAYNTYGSYDGTSMATPHVTGAVALCASINPALSASQLRNILLTNTQATTSLTGKVATGGRLDVSSMVPSCAGGAGGTGTPQPLSINTTSLPSGKTGTPYSQTLTSSGGTSTTSWSVTAGALPDSLSLSGGGVLSGTPSVVGTFNFTVTATNGTETATQALSISVTAPVLPGVFDKTSPANATSASTITTTNTKVPLSWAASANATSYQVCLSTVVPTVGQATCSTTWRSTTSLGITFSGLSRRTSYYWQVVAVAADGTTQANAGTWWRINVG